MGCVSTVIDDEMMAVFDALDTRRKELILTCSQFLLEEQQEDERDQRTAPARLSTHLVGHLDGISTTRREVVKLGAKASRRGPVGQRSDATMVRSQR
jgi:hypothetical protein